jgi:hypothetical protein
MIQDTITPRRDREITGWEIRGRKRFETFRFRGQIAQSPSKMQFNSKAYKEPSPHGTGGDTATGRLGETARLPTVTCKHGMEQQN